MAETEGLVVRLEATQARFERDMRRAEQSLARTAARMEGRTRQLNSRLDGIGANFAMGFVRGVVGPIATLETLRRTITSVVRNGDELRRLEGRFEAVTGSATRAGEAMASVLRISGETGASIDAVASAVTSFTIAAEAVGATDEQVAALAETFVKLGQIGGSSQEALNNSIRQFGQGLAGGIVRAEEFNSVLENTPLVVQAIADGLGVTIGQLRQMVIDGELTASKAFEGILAKTDEVRDKFEALPPSLQRSAGRLAVAWAQFSAELDRSLGISERLAAVLDDVAGRLPLISDAITGNAANQLRELDGTLQRVQSEILALSEQRLALDASGISTVAVDNALNNLLAQERDLVERRRALVAEIKGAAASADAAASTGPTTRPRITRAGPGAPLSLPKNFTPPTPPMDLGMPDLARGGAAARGDDQAIQIMERMRERIILLQEEITLVGKSEEEQTRLAAAFDRERIVRELLEAAAREGATITQEEIILAQNYAAETETLTIALANQKAALEAKADAEKEAEERAKEHARAIADVSDRLTSAIQQADSFADALKNIGIELLNLSVQGLAGEGPLKSILGGVLPAVVGAVGSAFGGPNVGTTDAFGIGAPFAKGGVFKAGKVTAFASGGVVTRPTVFPMADGVGQMGEAGPEAIMPLAKGPGGKLGVRAVGGGGGSFTFVSNIDARGSTLSEGQFRSIAQQEAQRAVAGLVSARRDDPTLLR